MIEAAGGLVWRRTDEGQVEVLLVHRPKYDDWSLPKGKLDEGETHEAGALREVEEETGLRLELGDELPEVRYHDRFGRPKRVRYWTMEAVAVGGFTPNDEVDELRWLPADRARRLLTYGRDRELLDALPRSGSGS